MACILKYVTYVFFDILKALFFYKKGGEKSPVFLPGMPLFFIHFHYNNIHHEHDFIAVYSIF